MSESAPCRKTMSATADIQKKSGILVVGTGDMLTCRFINLCISFKGAFLEFVCKRLRRLQQSVLFLFSHLVECLRHCLNRAYATALLRLPANMRVPEEYVLEQFFQFGQTILSRRVAFCSGTLGLVFLRMRSRIDGTGFSFDVMMAAWGR